MSVLAGLGGGHLYNFAWTSLQHHIAVLTQSRALHGVGGGGARLTSLEVKIRICHGAMGQGRYSGKKIIQMTLQPNVKYLLQCNYSIIITALFKLNH